MPVVPTYQPQVREQALEGGFQKTPDVSSDLIRAGQGLATLGTAVGYMAERDAQAKASDVESKITEEWMKWDASKEGRAKYRGENANGYEPAAEAWWEDARKTYGKDLDPRASALASRSLQAKKTTAMGNVVSFTAAEKERHADETYAADVNTTIQFGVTSGNVAGTAVQVREKAVAIGARKGWTTEQVQAEQSKNLSALHLAQISKLAEQDPVKAQAYYDANKAEVGFAQQPRVEEILRKEVDNQFATQFAAEQAGKPLSEQLKATAEIKDPARREKALIEVKNNYALVQQAQAEQEKKFSDAAWQLVGQGKRVPEAILASMDGKERVQLQEHLRAKAERGLAAPKTDPKDHARLIDMMLNDPEGFKKERLAAARLSPTDLEQFATKQQAMRNPTGGAKQDSIFTDDQRVYGALTKAGVDPKKNPNAAYQVRSEIDRRVRADSLAKGGRDLTPDEKQKHIDDVLVDKVFVNEFGRDPQKPLTLLTPEEQKNAYVVVNGEEIKLSSIPLNDRMGITESLRRRGEPISEQAIAEVYARVKKSAAPVAPAALAAPAAPATPAARTTSPTSFPAPGTALRPPSIYASAEEWAAYRAAQAQKNAKP